MSARVVASQRLPASDSVAIVGNSDALAVLAANALVAHGLTSHGSAVTFARQEASSSYSEAIRARVHDPAVGAVLVVHVPPVEVPSDESVRAALQACTDCGPDAHAPVVAVMARRPSADETGAVPVFVDIESAVGAIADARSMARWRAADAVRAARQADEDEWPEVAAPPGPAVLEGPAAARLVEPAFGASLVLDLDSSGVTGCVIRLVDDPLFGMVLCVGVDDPVAEAARRPGAPAGPRHPRPGRATCSRPWARCRVLTRGASDPAGSSTLLARAISDVSHLHLRVPGVTGAVLRHAGRPARRG